MSGRFDIRATPIDGLSVIARRPIADNRGFLERLYCSRDLADDLGDRTVEQVNRTLTVKQGTVRGLHYQRAPHAEAKVVSCIRGSVFDVAVDLRAGSPTFLKWHAEMLGAENGMALVIPEGFAHGFQTLEPMCELVYFHTAHYESTAEGGLNCRDSAIGIAWPSEITDLSERDAALPFFSDAFEGLKL